MRMATRTEFARRDRRIGGRTAAHDAIGASGAHGTPQALDASRTTFGVALLTEIAVCPEGRPADDPSTVRLGRR